jgi:hypothetical protein
MPEPAVPSNEMAHCSDYRRIFEPAFVAGSTSHVVKRPFMGQTMLAVNPPGA